MQRGADRKFSKFLDDEISVEKGQCLIYVKDILSLGSIGGVIHKGLSDLEGSKILIEALLRIVETIQKSGQERGRRWKICRRIFVNFFY